MDEPEEPGDDAHETHQYQSLVVACLSANLSRAGWWENVECAHIEEIPAQRHGGTDNLEAAFLVDISNQKLPKRWWLKPLERDAERFVESAPDEADGLDHPPFGVAIRYDWGEGTLAVRLEGEMALPIEVEEISGRRLFTIERGDVERWCACDDNAAARVGETSHRAASWCCAVAMPTGECWCARKAWRIAPPF